MSIMIPRTLLKNNIAMEFFKENRRSAVMQNYARRKNAFMQVMCKFMIWTRQVSKNMFTAFK